MRNISPDEELTTDYALFGDDDSEMQCQCGTASCRGTIGGRDWQRPELQRKYGNYFSTQPPAPAESTIGRALTCPPHSHLPLVARFRPACGLGSRRSQRRDARKAVGPGPGFGQDTE